MVVSFSFTNQVKRQWDWTDAREDTDFPAPAILNVRGWFTGHTEIARLLKMEFRRRGENGYTGSAKHSSFWKTICKDKKCMA